MGRRGPKSIYELAAIPANRTATAHDQPATVDKLTPPPDHLQPATKAWWTAVIAHFDLQPHQLRTLQAAAESWDRKEQAREALTVHGLVYTDGKGMVRARPEVAIERDGRVAYLRSLRELNLEVEPPNKFSLRKPWE